MRITQLSRVHGVWNLGVLALFCGFFVFSAPMAAQCNTNTTGTSTGFNALYGLCSGSTNVQGGFAMVDATQFNSTDICLAMKSIFGISAPFLTTPNTYNPGNSVGVVIDARGYTGTLTCSVNPWVNPQYTGWDWHTPTTESFSNVILLPAGNIKITQTLALPENTKLIGQGPGITTLVAANSFAYSDMIDMGTGPSPYPTVCPGTPQDCTGVAIEHLSLNGNSQSINGIVNHYSQELSYVNDVGLTGFTGGTGLWLNTYSNNSGPYTNISYSGGGICAQIYDNVNTQKINQTRGIHGLTCTVSGSSSTAVIYLDAPNNSLEDVYISGGPSQYGIYVGSQEPAYNNVLFNVYGSGLADVVYIDNANNVSDLSILGVTRSGGTNSIKDALTNTTLNDSTVGMYVVGESVFENTSTLIGTSRFTTSVNAGSTAGNVTWLVGSHAAPSSGSCAAGSLYSCSNSSNCNTTSTPYTLWGCQGSSTWHPIR